MQRRGMHITDHSFFMVVFTGSCNNNLYTEIEKKEGQTWNILYHPFSEGLFQGDLVLN